MKRIMLCALLAVGAGSAHAQAQAVQKSDKECGADEPGEYLSLPVEEFDRTLGKGWRIVGDVEGCERAGANLIAAYRDEVLAQRIAGLDWHEAQLRASAGEVDKAIALFERNLAFRHLSAAETGHYADVLYGEATVAFLRGDRSLLEQKRSELAALPRPDWFDALATEYRARSPAGAATLAWPMNLNVVDGLLACFGKPYREAYSFACQSGRNQ